MAPIFHVRRRRRHAAGKMAALGVWHGRGNAPSPQGCPRQGTTPHDIQPAEAETEGAEKEHCGVAGKSRPAVRDKNEATAGPNRLPVSGGKLPVCSVVTLGGSGQAPRSLPWSPRDRHARIAFFEEWDLKKFVGWVAVLFLVPIRVPAVEIN